MSNEMGKNGLGTPEVSEKASRRRYSAEYKSRILDEGDRCDQLGQLGELLRREGLYSSLFSNWRKQRSVGSNRSLFFGFSSPLSCDNSDCLLYVFFRFEFENPRALLVIGVSFGLHS